MWEVSPVPMYLKVTPWAAPGKQSNQSKTACLNKEPWDVEGLMVDIFSEVVTEEQEERSLAVFKTEATG